MPRLKISSAATTGQTFERHLSGRHDAPHEGRVLEGSRLDADTLERLLLTTAIGLYLVVLLRSAWVTEDAYVTFRSLDNFVQGHGLRWNALDRVQAFSNPLWLFVLGPLYLGLGDPYATSLVMSVILSLGAVVLCSRSVASNRTVGIFVVVALTSSRAFIDYSTSGLENPLTHFLLALFFVSFARSIRSEKGPSPGRLAWMSAVVGLLAVNRLDTITLCLPSLVHAWMRSREKRRTLASLTGLLPLATWEVISLVYFGSLIPNTAYAKLNTGIDKLEIWTQGGVYLVDLLGQDPLSVLLLFLAVVAPLAMRARHLYGPVLGLVGYLLYIVSIGGDFMSGRFFSAPIFLSCIVLSQIPVMKLTHALTGAAVVLGLSLFGPNSPLSSDPELQMRPFGASGVADERSYYYPSSGLLRLARSSPFPDNSFLGEGRRDRDLADERSDLFISRRINVGFYGYAAGRKVHVIDRLALGDALLARLPASYEPRWRVGHYDRVVPAGYEESLRTGSARLADPKLNQYYEKLRLVTQGPIWSWARFRAIWGFHTGKYESLIDKQRYRFTEPGQDREPLSWDRVALSSAHFAEPLVQPVVRFSGASSLIQSKGAQRLRRFKWHYTSPRPSHLYFLHGTRIVGKVSLPKTRPKEQRAEPISVPDQARQVGFDAVYFRGEPGEFPHELFGIELL